MSRLFATSFAIVFSAAVLVGQSLPLLQLPQSAPFIYAPSVQAFDDLDNDGVEDFFATFHFPGSSMIQIVSGRTGQVIRPINGSQNGIAHTETIGCFDADGIKDYVMATQGMIVVRSGTDDTPLLTITLPSGSHPEFFYGANIHQTTPLGTANHDLMVLLRLPHPDPSCEGFYTAIHRFDGQSGALTSVITTPGNEVPADIDIMSDLDGDGVEDILCSTYDSCDPNAPAFGTGYAMSGANGSVLRTYTDGSSLGFARQVKTTDDIDGDGLKDFAALKIGYGNDPLRIYSSHTGLMITQISVSNSTRILSFDVGKDLNGDGLNDISMLTTVPHPFMPTAFPRTQFRHYSLSDQQLIDASVLGRPSFERESHEWSIPDSNGDGIAEIMRIQYVEIPFSSSNDRDITIRATMGAQGCDCGPTALNLNWRHFPANPKHGRVTITGAVPHAPMLILVSSAAAGPGSLIPGTTLPLFLDLSATIGSDFFNADAHGEHHIFEVLQRPQIAGQVLFLQVAELGPNPRVSSVLELLYSV